MKSYRNEHGKNWKAVSKQNNYKYQGREKFFATPLLLNSKINAPSLKRVNQATITHFIGPVIYCNFALPLPRKRDK